MSCSLATDHMNMNANLTANAKLQPQAIDQDSIISDLANSESEVDNTQYTPSESSTMSDVEAPYFIPGTKTSMCAGEGTRGFCSSECKGSRSRCP